jgi:predicted secreted protein
MRLPSILTVLGLSLSVAGVACTAPSADDASQADPQTSDGAEQEVKAAVFGESDNGKTVSVVSGRSFTIALPQNASTGYVWKVTSVDRSLGYPKESTVPGNPARPGDAGMKKFTWKTKSPFSLVGKHSIKIEQIRPSDTPPVPAATFSLTVDITDAALAAMCGGLLGKSCAAGQYCEYTAEQACGAGDQSGTCQPTGPGICPLIYLPVCGCNGKTYGNSCEANRAGTSVASGGECAAPPAKPQPGQPGGVTCGDTTCAAGMVCCNKVQSICTAPGMACIM